jgi:hypothetical protein
MWLITLILHQYFDISCARILTSFAVLLKSTNFASLDESVTFFWSLIFQEIGDPYGE